MVYEIAEIDVKAGAEAAFEAAVAEAAACFKSAKGCISLELHRTVERPAVYRLVVGWESVEAHMVDFRQSPGFQEWRRLAGPHFAKPPTVEHVQVVLTAFSA
jgi:quinol monooxygenase YgiN